MSQAIEDKSIFVTGASSLNKDFRRHCCDGQPIESKQEIEARNEAGTALAIQSI